MINVFGEKVANSLNDVTVYKKLFIAASFVIVYAALFQLSYLQKREYHGKKLNQLA